MLASIFFILIPYSLIVTQPPYNYILLTKKSYNDSAFDKSILLLFLSVTHPGLYAFPKFNSKQKYEIQSFSSAFPKKLCNNLKTDTEQSG